MTNRFSWDDHEPNIMFWPRQTCFQSRARAGAGFSTVCLWIWPGTSNKLSCSLGFKPWGRLGRCGIGCFAAWWDTARKGSPSCFMKAKRRNHWRVTVGAQRVQYLSWIIFGSSSSLAKCICLESHEFSSFVVVCLSSQMLDLWTDIITI